MRIFHYHCVFFIKRIVFFPVNRVKLPFFETAYAEDSFFAG